MSKTADIQTAADALGMLAAGVDPAERRSIAEAVEHFRRAGSMAFGGRPTRDRPSRPYRQVTAVRAAVAKKAKCLSMLPVTVSTADDRIIESGPVVDLFARPNPRMSGKDFIAAISAFIDLSGACHLVFTRLVGRRPLEITPVSTWQMRPITDRPGGMGELTGWKFRPIGRRWDEAETLTLDEVWTIGEDSYDPDAPHAFSSPLEAALLATAQVFKSDVANEASLDNGVVPSGVFTMEGTPTEEQIRDTREQISSRSGVTERQRPLVVYGGLQWQQMAATFVDMEFSTLQSMKVADICAALEVDPAAIGYYEDSNYAHAEAAKAGLWIDTVLPRAAWIADELTRGVLSRFEGEASYRMHRAAASAARMPDRLRRSGSYRRARAVSRGASVIWFDDSAVHAVRKAMLDRSKEAAIWIDKLKATPEDVIETLDLPLPIHPWQKLAWQAIGEMPIGEETPMDEDPPGGPEDEPVENPPAQDEETETGKGLSAAIRTLTESELARLHRLWRTSWAGIERAARGKVSRHFDELRREMLRRLDVAMASRELRSIEVRDVVAELLFDLAEANGRLWAKVGPLMRVAADLGGQQSMDEAAAAEGKKPEDAQRFNLADPGVEQALRARRVKVSMSNVTLRRKLDKSLGEAMREALADGLDKGQTQAKLAETIRQQFSVVVGKSKMIARTEIGAAVEQARSIGRDQAGVPLKSWLWSRKETGRPSHQATEAATLESPIPQSSLFNVAGHQARHPRDSSLPAGEVLNCGCTTIARYPGDSIKDARLIAHLRSRGFLSFEQLQQRRQAAEAH